MPVEEIEKLCQKLRVTVDKLEKDILELRFHPVFTGEPAREDQHAEMKANIMLAYRHAEDCRMRLGKVIQHATTGVSCYDKK